jgi:DNA primase
MTELEQIKERVSVVDLISESVTLKKAGRNFKGLCPFHNERTPSFVVSPERNIWHCFGCGKGGDIFTFLMELEHLEFSEALKILAERAGVKLESRMPSTPQSQLKDRLIEIHHLAEEFYHFILTKHVLGERARLYLKERGVTDAVLATFKLGFAPSSWDNLARFLLKKGYTQKELELSGVVIRGNHGIYDRFRARIMFPLKDHRGITIAFSGRVLSPTEKEAKYINSPETPLYIKGNTFFGLSVTKEAIRKAGSAIVVEGEFDVISSFQVGVAHVVAVKGSALTEAQIRLIKRFTDKILLALDRDVAGDSAARRGIEIADRAGLEVRVIEVPTGKDPDEAARSSPGLWKKAVGESQPYFDFLIASAFERFKNGDVYSKKKIGDELLPVLTRMENTIVQAHYVKVLAVQLSLSEVKIIEALK